MRKGIIFRGAEDNSNPEMNAICLGFVNLSKSAQLCQRIINHILPNLVLEDLILLKKKEPTTIPITDKNLVAKLCDLDEHATIQLETMLEDASYQFGLSLDLISAKSADDNVKCFLLEIQKFDPGEGPSPEDRPDGDDDVEPHAEIEEPKPMAMARAAGA